MQRGLLLYFICKVCLQGADVVVAFGNYYASIEDRLPALVEAVYDGLGGTKPRRMVGLRTSLSSLMLQTAGNLLGNIIQYIRKCRQQRFRRALNVVKFV
ncbi:MAG: hypothetical protein EZS28_046331 [Streblomastix strix]|uniref:Uncharacterized protein n=1 Tax=Streblomastix strix TaxID=222440 RepID=A0A5J4TK84_9EUKA|nr:MAG: hypothetical protein EZS28_046331 [Streblomastix strix]